LKLLIISPRWEKFRHWPFHMSLLGPLTVAGLTPEHWEVEYIDENARPGYAAASADLVAISAMTAQAAQGYEIADHFRARGVPVVIGGTHATLVPEDAAAHADAVVVGEAEGIWPRVLADFEQGRLQPRYERQGHVDFGAVGDAFPRRDLLPAVGYTRTAARTRAVDTIQAGRGCARQCEHCNVPAVLGVRYRPRALERVIEEIASTEALFLFFVDDCLPTEQEYFSQLFTRLAGSGRHFLSVGALHMVENPAYLRRLVRGGLEVLYIGFDRLDPSWRPLWARRAGAEPYHVDIKLHDIDFCRDFLQRPRLYLEAVRRLRDEGIKILATFAFGFDQDDPSIFERSLEFALAAEVELADFAVLTPYPGSPLALRLEREGRILHRDWSRYNGCHAVFRPAQMTPEQLEEGVLWAWKTFNAEKPIYRRMIETFRGDGSRGTQAPGKE